MRDDVDGRLPLHSAAFGHHPHAEVVKFLLEFNDLNAVDRSGRTPFHLAAMKSKTKVMEFLMSQKGIKLDTTDVDGDTPLHCLTSEGHEHLLKAALATGCKVKADKSGRTPLHWACQHGNETAFDLLMQQEHTNKVKWPLMKAKEPLIFAAVRGGNPKIIRKVAPKNLHTIRDDFRNCLLMIGASSGFIESVEVLIELGCTPDKVNNKGHSALHLAILEDKEKVAKYLIAIQGHKDKADKKGSFAIHMAASLNMVGVIRDLVEVAGVDPSLPEANKAQRTPLHLAAFKGLVKAVETLLELGANPKAKDDFRQTALDVATAKEHQEVVALLL